MTVKSDIPKYIFYPIAEITSDPSVWFVEVTDELMVDATKNLNGIIVISETQNCEIF